MVSKMDTVTNAAMLVMCAIVAGTALRSWRQEAPVVRPAAVGPVTPYEAGARIAGIESVGLGDSRTLVLVLNTKCKFCAASLPFYQQLASLPQMNGHRTRLVVLATDDQLAMTGYLKAHQIRVDGVFLLAQFKMPEVQATPSVIIVDAKGAVVASWTGLLTTAEQERVRELITT
jgi:hypothetical protein